MKHVGVKQYGIKIHFNKVHSLVVYIYTHLMLHTHLNKLQVPPCVIYSIIQYHFSHPNKTKQEITSTHNTNIKGTLEYRLSYIK